MERTINSTAYTIGMDDVTGRAVIIRNGREVIGALSREQSVLLAQNVMEWMPPAMRPMEKEATVS